jgi:hypothetical protein
MQPTRPLTAEHVRLATAAPSERSWKRWGPYLPERQWGTVREDYSPDGDAWNYFTHDQSRSRVYRWGEDGLLGFCDDGCRLCFSVALWNGEDPILKERLFGVTNAEGNHGEDVKEEYCYLDSTPTHSYTKALYKYPQREFPYQALVDANKSRGLDEPEFELADTGIFAENRYFEIQVEYAKASPNDILIKITATNRGPDAATIHILPQLCFRNTWAWGSLPEASIAKPKMQLMPGGVVACHHRSLGDFVFHAEKMDGEPANFLFTENESNLTRLFDAENYYPNVRDGFHEYLIRDKGGAINSAHVGTKCAAYHGMEVGAGASVTLRLRLRAAVDAGSAAFSGDFEKIFRQRMKECDAFYKAIISPTRPVVEQRLARLAYANVLFSKQFYHYDVRQWLEGDPAQPPPPAERWHGRNHEWLHLKNSDVISVPDKWEYPWYATWDLAFHVIALAEVDLEFARQQILLLLSDRYQHPSGALPANEFNFSDRTPPMLAYALWRIYEMTGRADRGLLERAFPKLLHNFNHWIDCYRRADGFLSLDNIGAFDCRQTPPMTSALPWLSFFAAAMVAIADELKSGALPGLHRQFEMLLMDVDRAWNDDDGFYYGRFRANHHDVPIAVRSIFGFGPLFPAQVLGDGLLEKFPAAVPSRENLRRMLKCAFDESEFLSPFGLRSLSKIHRDHPFKVVLQSKKLEAHYSPGDSDTTLFGGNTNWRGPIWLPLNYLFIESLYRYHDMHGPGFRIEYPTGAGTERDLRFIADDLKQRLLKLFVPGSGDLPLFHESFNPETGQGIGSSHQTATASLIAKLLTGSGHRYSVAAPKISTSRVR